MIDNVILMQEIFGEIKLGNPGGHLDLIGVHKLTNQNNQFMLDMTVKVRLRCSSLTELLGQCDCVMESHFPGTLLLEIFQSVCSYIKLSPGLLNCRKAIPTKLSTRDVRKR